MSENDSCAPQYEPSTKKDPTLKDQTKPNNYGPKASNKSLELNKNLTKTKFIVTSNGSSI